MTNESAHALAVEDETVRNDSGNAQLQDAIIQRLGSSPHQALRRVEVSVDSQRVVLSGTVPSFYLKQIAQETVRQACPDRKLSNELTVK